ncbi:MAG: DUF1844 domain-containing protein [Candidatus Hydrogenedentota bacterium]
MSDENSDNPEIIIDEGWKSNIEKERQQAADEAERAESTDDEAQTSEEDYKLTIFDSLVSGLAAQTMVALGLTGEEGAQVQVDMAYAHHLIGTLMMLQEKTAGNLEDSEAANLDEAVGELHRVFMIREEQVVEMQGQQPDNIQQLHVPDNQ